MERLSLQKGPVGDLVPERWAFIFSHILTIQCNIALSPSSPSFEDISATPGQTASSGYELWNGWVMSRFRRVGR